MPHHPDFAALFHQDNEAVVSLPQGNRDELQATKRSLERALVCHQQPNETNNVSLDKINYWDCLRRHYLLQPKKFSIILNLASRHSLTWTNKFIESLVQLDTGTQTFTVNAKRLETLIFLQTHCGLQSRDLSNAESPHTIHDDNVRLLERAIEGDNFNEHFLDEVSGFLKTLEHSDAMNWTMFLVKQEFLNFSMLHKKCFIEEAGQRRAIDEGAFLRWLTQWATQCGVAENMMQEGAFEAEFIADSALSSSQRTLRNMVHYGLSPNWLALVQRVITSDVVQEGVTPHEIIQVNANFQSALEHHQKQDGTFDKQCAKNEFVQAIVGQSVEDDTEEVEPDEHNHHEWLQTYTAPKDQHALRRLREVLSLERLKFYHDYHRLPVLIKQVQEEKLSLAEVAEYDKPPVYSEREQTLEEPDDDERDDLKQDYNYISELMVIKPRKLPRLLARFTDEDMTSFSPSEMARYDLADFDPKYNFTRRITMPRRPHLQAMFNAHEEYLDNLFNQLIMPVAEERSRLYREWHRLNKKIIDTPQAEHSVGLLSCFYKTPRQEMALIEEKIELLSGFVREQCVNLKALERKVAECKREGQLPPEDDYLEPKRIEHYRTQLGIKRRHETGLAGMLQLDPFYHQELRGMVAAPDLNINHTKNGDVVCFRVVTNEARDSVASFLKATIGAFLAIPTILAATVTAFQVKALSLKTFYGHFFRTQSHQAICKAEETAGELLKKRKNTEDSERGAAEEEIKDPSSAPLVTL